MSDRPCLGGGQVLAWPGEPAASHVLRRFGVLGRIGDLHGRRTNAPGPRIARRRLAVERQVQDLAEWRARILRRREALPLARRQEQRLPVAREQDDGAELTAL